MSLIIDVVAQVSHAQNVCERPETVPLVLPEAALEPTPVMVREDALAFELVLPEVADIHVMFTRNITPLALSSALKGLTSV